MTLTESLQAAAPFLPLVAVALAFVILAAVLGYLDTREQMRRQEIDAFCRGAARPHDRHGDRPAEGHNDRTRRPAVSKSFGAQKDMEPKAKEDNPSCATPAAPAVLPGMSLRQVSTDPGPAPSGAGVLFQVLKGGRS
jgi:hypothetical protein